MTITANVTSQITSVESHSGATTVNYYLTAPKIATAYDIPYSTGAGVKVGIISLGGGYNQADLNRSMSDLGLTAPTVTFVPVDGATNTYTGSAVADTENALDLICVAGMVPQANIVLYKAKTINDNGSLYLTDYANVFQRAINENCDIITHSWGGSESTDFLSVPLANAAAKGITVFISTGDYGSTADGTTVSASYPATNSNVIAVGGTYLTLNTDNTRLNETVYNNSESPDGAGGAGGISSMVSLPTWPDAWQAGLTYRKWFKSNSSAGPITTLTTRGVPDVALAMNAYGVWLNGSLNGYSGTSASAPIMAGIIARLRAINGGKFSSAQLNSIFYNNSRAFYDILTGNDASLLNTGYVASPNWDPVTGMGVPIGNVIQIFLPPPPSGPLSGLFLQGTVPPSQLPTGLPAQTNSAGIAPNNYGVNGTGYIKNSGTYNPVKGLSYKTAANVWTPVQQAYIKKSDNTWEQWYPAPAGNLQVSTTNLSYSPYQYQYDTAWQRVTVVNTGNDSVVIANVIANDSASNYSSYIDYTGMNSQGFPLTLYPGASAYMDVAVLGNVLGTYSGNITMINTIGVLGYSNVVIPVTATVQIDYGYLTANVSSLPFAYYAEDTPPTTTFSVTNTGVGGNATITSVSTANGTTVSNLVVALGSGTVVFRATPPVISTDGNYTDIITINHNLPNQGPLKIPVTMSVTTPHGSQSFDPGYSTFTVPTGVHHLTIDAQGAGGGGGGRDSQLGHSGFDGHQVSGTISVSAGDVIQVYVGGGGGAGWGPVQSGGGGGGGYSPNGYNGGGGGNAGNSGVSGGGGGGGGATVIVKNGTTILVAAGGGGGGGGGQASPGRGQQGYESSGSTAGGEGQSHYGDVYPDPGGGYGGDQGGGQ